MNQIPMLAPSYNAVKIDVHNPSVNAPGCQPQQYAQAPQFAAPQYSASQYAPVTAPQYNYPQTQLYNYQQAAQQPYYMPQMTQPNQYAAAPQDAPQASATANAAATAPYGQACPAGCVPLAQVLAAQTPNVPVRAIALDDETLNALTNPVNATAAVATPMPAAHAQAIQNNYNAPAVPQPVVTQTPVEVNNAAASTVSAAPVQKPEIIPPEPLKPQVDLNAFLAKLTNPDYEVQAAAMEEIANMVKDKPDMATELLDEKIINVLAAITNADSTKLAGPNQEQISARQKLMSGQKLSEAEQNLAMTITPMEQAERNKSYAMFTTAILQKLYADEVAKLTGNTVPLTELPGAVTVVENLKDNDNPMVRTSAIEALSYIQNPAYKQDLTTLFTIAQNDADQNVKEAAKAALEKLKTI
jgi:hypothetical protein